MNLRKHVDGFAVFLIILSISIFIYEYLNFPAWKVHHEQAVTSLPQRAIDRQQSIKLDVRQVSLDFIKGKSYTTLALKLNAGQPVPEKLFVTTVFFTPNYAPRGGWSSKTEIRRPFASGDRTEVTAIAECAVCVPFDTPRDGYFARVYVSTEYADNSNLPDAQFDSDIATAVPVVVHWPDAIRTSAINSKNIPADKINFSGH
jgi:hypothetical protein